MKTKEKIIVFGLAALIALLTGFYFFVPGKKNSRPPVQEQQNKTVTVYQNLLESTKNQNEFTRTVLPPGKTALYLLQKTAAVKTQGEGAMAFVTDINGIKADNAKKEFWAFYVNGKPAEVGAGSYIIHSGDRILWKLEKY